jgi:hypothetical protein
VIMNHGLLGPHYFPYHITHGQKPLECQEGWKLCKRVSIKLG